MMKMTKIALGCTAALLAAQANAVVLVQDDFEAGIQQFSTFNAASNRNWQHDTFTAEGITASATMNGFGGDTDSDDWLISPEIDLTLTEFTGAIFSFNSRVRYDGMNLVVMLSTDYVDGTDPATATWVEASDYHLPTDGNGSDGSAFESSSDINISAYLGQTMHIGFHYLTTRAEANNNGAWYIDDFIVQANAGDLVLPLSATLAIGADGDIKTTDTISYFANALNGEGAYSFAWDFGNGDTAEGQQVDYQYPVAGNYTVSVTVTDEGEGEVVLSEAVSVLQPAIYQVAEKLDPEHIRVAAFNVSMEAQNYESDSDVVVTEGSNILVTELTSGENQQIKNIAEIIQRTRPDVILLNEFDYIADENSGVESFIELYLKQAQSDEVEAIDYPYYFVSTVNTGKPTDFDLDNNGEATGNMGDAIGFGLFEGQYGMVLLSRFEIDEDNIRTFQNFLWKDMPGALLPVDPDTNEAFYTDEELEILSLSSKSHWDVPVIVDGQTIHLLASHPTPPVFDGPEDRNGTRNHDEIRFWADYIDHTASDYIYDDAGMTGGLPRRSSFIVVGDQNASADEGDAYDGAIEQLLNSPLVNTVLTPMSDGGEENSGSDFAATHTASWGMRADYVLPSHEGLAMQQAGVFWPTEETAEYSLIESRGASSDHRLVWADVALFEPQSDDDSDDNEDEPDYEIDVGGSMGWFVTLLALVGLRRRK